MSCVRDIMAASHLPRLETRMLLEHVLRKPRAWLLAHDDEALDDSRVAAFWTLSARRASGEPMAYLLGEREFMGHVFHVTSDVLIPRPETELLVEIASEFLADRPQADVVDMGTGSGAIAISLALAYPHARIEASDYSDAAHRLLVSADWTVSRQSNRLGALLDGPELTPQRRREQHSHGILPGVIQIPPSGRPMVQLCDANTCGGYPLIGTLISAHLHLFGQLRPGAKLRLRRVELEDALRAREVQAARLADINAIATLARIRTGLGPAHAMPGDRVVAQRGWMQGARV